jgi:hypothetical protein
MPQLNFHPIFTKRQACDLKVVQNQGHALTYEIAQTGFEAQFARLAILQWTALPTFTADPLPFTGMSVFPYPAAETYRRMRGTQIT